MFKRWLKGRASSALSSENSRLLTEQEVARSWRQLFHKGAELTDERLERAETLLEEMRDESPLRLRLGLELQELRKMQHA